MTNDYSRTLSSTAALKAPPYVEGFEEGNRALRELRSFRKSFIMSTTGHLIQMRLDFDSQPHLVAANDLYQEASQSVLVKFKEDRRIERKPATYPPRSLGDYFSMFANTVPEGGLIVLGMENSIVIPELDFS